MKIPKKRIPSEEFMPFFDRSGIHIFLGDVRSGKTATLFYWVEQLHIHSDRTIVILNSDPSVLPDWISLVEDIRDVPNHSVCIMDDLALFYSSLESPRTEKRRILNRFLVLSGQKDICILASIQNLSLLDISFLRVSGVAFHLKYMSENSLSFERDEVRDFLVPLYRIYHFLYPYSSGKGFTLGCFPDGIYPYEVPLPTFWNEDLSRLWKNYDVGGEDGRS